MFYPADSRIQFLLEAFPRTRGEMLDESTNVIQLDRQLANPKLAGSSVF